MRKIRAGLVCVVGAFLVALAPQGRAQRPNVLVLLADDVGVDMLASYAEGTDLPVTPNLDALARQGILFRNAYGNPLCSPTRASILTGRHGFRTGIGDVVNRKSQALPLAEITLPEALDLGLSTYSHAAIGKWHLGNASVGGGLAPNLAGFGHYDGALPGFLGPPPLGYFRWPRTIDGSEATETGYATTVNVDAAIGWIRSARDPWLCYVAFNAAHTPFHAPPVGLYHEDLTGLDPITTPRPFYKAMIEAMDAEIGRLATALGAELQNTLVIFLGDNGAPSSVIVPPFPSNHGKGTVYEGGINVPLILWGPQVAFPGSECTGLVNLADLFATVAEVAGVDPAQALPGVRLDSVSLVPYLTDPFQPSLRSFAYSEFFQPNGAKGLAATKADRAIREQRYKLVRRADASEFYDLWTDPYEQENLIGSLSAQQTAIFDSLQQQMLSMLRNP